MQDIKDAIVAEETKLNTRLVVLRRAVNRIKRRVTGGEGVVRKARNELYYKIVNVFKFLYRKDVMNVFGWTTGQYEKINTSIENALTNAMCFEDEVEKGTINRHVANIALNMFTKLQRFILFENITLLQYQEEDISLFPKNTVFRVDQQVGDINKVDLYALFNGEQVIVKYEKDNLYKDVPGNAMYEATVQLYLQSVYKNHRVVKIPTLHLVRSLNNQVVLCMSKARGSLLIDLPLHHIRSGFVSVFQTLKILQEDVGFMHNDFHCENVFYNEETDGAEIIDFGMSCVNPPPAKDVAWQGVSEYRSKKCDTFTTRCDNRSFDVCVLLDSVMRRSEEARSDPLLFSLWGEMKEDLNILADDQYAVMGTIETELEEFFPENILVRIT